MGDHNGMRPMSVAALAEQNRHLYEHPKIATHYAGDTALTLCESVVLQQCRADYVDKHVLDLGVGAGRTTPWLAPGAASYVGLDYSQIMVTLCKARHPDRTILWGDARNFSTFADGSFDFVFFSYNGIDAVGHADRQRILREIARVIRPSGMLAFSSHNLDCISHWPMHRDILRLNGRAGPINLLKHCARVAIRTRNVIRNRRLEDRSPEYAVLTDRGHNLAFLSYHIGPQAQARQLADAGFSLVEILDLEGLPVVGTSEAHFLYYLARRNSPRSG
jgi:SAM-dependent methyltransferase